MNNWRLNRLESARNGTNPTVLAKLSSGYAVIGDTQFLPGYCVLLADPSVSSLNELSPTDRIAFLSDMALLGDAIFETYQPRRLNYEILGNTDTFFARAHFSSL